MLFNSWEFLIFFPIVVLTYFILPKRIKRYWLLLASYYFYMCWNPKYILLILFSTFVTYLSGICIHYIDNHSISVLHGNKVAARKLVVAISFVTNLSLLAYFKYFNFMISNLNMVLRRAINYEFDYVSIVLPVGISFFTFQALGYTVDVYRNKIEAEKSFINYALFVSFFPQLVAGPIERSENLLMDIKTIPEKKNWDYERITSGLMTMLYGMFLKLVLADRLTILVDIIFDNYKKYNAVSLWIGAIGFSLQIYCDFAGYSTIAIGAARVLGFSLMENFDTPYFAKSIKEFWRRWHISLSTWFKDYLYIPLGGNRCSKLRQYFNLLVTFLVSGIWHGAGWHFIAWGGIHGIYQIAGSVLLPYKKRMCERIRLGEDSIIYKGLQILITDILVVIAWIFFRAPSLKISVKYIMNMFKIRPVDSIFANPSFSKVEWIVLIVALLVIFLVGLIKHNKKKTLEVYLSEKNIVFRWMIIFVLLFGTIIFGKYGPSYSQQAFIYFQF